MKAEEIIKIIRMSITPSEQVKHIENYARIQIEKDRERVAKKLLNAKVDIFTIQSLTRVPITLD